MFRAAKIPYLLHGSGESNRRFHAAVWTAYTIKSLQWDMWCSCQGYSSLIVTCGFRLMQECPCSETLPCDQKKKKTTTHPHMGYSLFYEVKDLVLK